MKNYIFVFVLLLPYTGFAQQPKIFQVINTSGGNMKSNTHYVTYSVGNTIIYKTSGTARKVTQGFQQPQFDVNNVTAINEIPETALIKAYPNPVSEELTVEYPSDKLKNLTLDIVNIEGRTLVAMQLDKNTPQASIPFQTYASGQYFLVFKQKGLIIKTVKVIKHY